MHNWRCLVYDKWHNFSLLHLSVTLLDWNKSGIQRGHSTDSHCLNPAVSKVSSICPMVLLSPSGCGSRFSWTERWCYRIGKQGEVRTGDGWNHYVLVSSALRRVTVFNFWVWWGRLFSKMHHLRQDVLCLIIEECSFLRETSWWFIIGQINFFQCWLSSPRNTEFSCSLLVVSRSFQGENHAEMRKWASKFTS